MKIGIFADIHGNIYAFEKIWKALKKESCDRYFFLGDICGYYYYQNEIIDILKGVKNLTSVIGNHDDMFLKMLRDENIEKKYTEKYGKSCQLLKSSIKPENLDFLKNLPGEKIIENGNIALFHGSPWDRLNGYVYPSNLPDLFHELPYKFIFLGHTHHPMNKKIGDTRIINPGSCGQPRDCNLASYVILDYKRRKVKLKRVEYNRRFLIKDIKWHSEKNGYLTKVLKKGEKRT